MNGNKAVTATFTRLLVDSEFTSSVDSADLRANSAGQDWYESRAGWSGGDATLLFLDTNNVGGDTSKKAGFTASTSGNAYLSQEFSTPQAGTFSAQWDIYVDSILDISSPDRAGIMLIGSDLDAQKGPSSADTERFVFLGFFKNLGGTSGTMDLVAMTAFSTYTTVVAGLNMKQWYTIKVVVNVPNRTYDVYVDGVFKATKTAPSNTLTSLTHISFAQWNDGAGAFYVDNVFAPAVDRYKLTVSTVGSGSLSVNPGESTYAPKTAVTLTATPQTGWSFAGWSGDLTSTDNPATITMNSGKSITATFTQDQYTLTVTVVGEGSVIVSPKQSTYTYGTVVTLSASASLGWHFSDWSGDLTGSTSPATITMTGNKAVIATFAQEHYTLTVNVVDSGSVTENPDQPTYTYGMVVTLSATADPGWSFSAWSGDVSGNANPATITMTGDKTLTATFTQDHYTLTVNVVGSGSVSKSPDQPTYTYSTEVTLTATASVGWHFAGWSGDLTGSTNPATITMNGNRAVTATFAQDQYTLTVNIVGQGSVSKSPDQVYYTYGTQVTLTATGAIGWYFTAWSGDISGSANPGTITMTGRKTVTATFIRGYTLTVNIVGQGSVTKNPDKTAYPQDTQVTLTATATLGWSFAGWSGDISGTNNP